jgi:hypothetical protein
LSTKSVSHKGLRLSHPAGRKAKVCILVGIENTKVPFWTNNGVVPLRGIVLLVLHREAYTPSSSNRLDRRPPQ